MSRSKTSLYDKDFYALNEFGSKIRMKVEQFYKNLIREEKITHPRMLRELSEITTAIASIESAYRVLEWRRKKIGDETK